MIEVVGDSEDDLFVPVPPHYWREIVIAAALCGATDLWDAWRDLFNAGYRGSDLSGWLLKARNLT